MLQLTRWTEGDVSLWVRADAPWDRRIAAEVQQLYAFPEARLREAAYVVDVGAHIGAFACWVKALNPGACVVAAEVDAVNFEMLRANVYGLDGVRAVWARVGYAEGDYVLLRDLENTGRIQVVPRAAVGADTTPEPCYAPRCTLEELAGPMPRVDVLKIDVEGAEYDILLHADLRRIRCIVGEYHGGVGRFRAELQPYLERTFDLVHMDEAPNWGRFCAVAKDVGG